MTIEEIEKRLSLLPKKMKWAESQVPMKVRDPKNPTKMIADPHGRMTQTRMDIISEDDPFKKPIIHFHKYPDHPMYEQNFKEYGDAFISWPQDADYLISENKRLAAELAALKGE